jgi:hypothetical protein
MDVSEGTTTANLLLGLSDAEWQKEMAAWDAKQKAAKAIAEAYYADDVATLNESLTSAVTGLEQDMTDAGLELGGNVTDGIVSGIQDGTFSVQAAMSRMIEAAFAAAKETAEISSPSKRAKRELGKQIDAGAAGGIDENAYMVADSAAAMLESAMQAFNGNSGDFSINPSMPTTSQIVAASRPSRGPSFEKLGESIINSMASMGGSGGITINPSGVYLNGTKIGEITYDVHKDISKQRGD